jgi:uncharacterized membrane protein YraQ (UPF0718 family)
MNSALDQDFYIFITVVTAIFLEAAPFLLLGALVSSFLEVYCPQDRIGKFLPKGRITGVLFGLGAGMLLPTCECGVVPIVRRLLLKNVPAHVAAAYMLAAPVINPIVLVSTYVAFRGDIWMVLGRVGVVALTAVTGGLWLGRMDPLLLVPHGEHDHIGHQGSDLDCDCGLDHEGGSQPRFIGALAHTAWEFLDMGKYLILGCLAAGLIKTFLPSTILTVFESNLFLAVAGMMLLAIIVSVCSEADSFVAASFWSFPKAAQLSFITIGPMVDLKLIMMYTGVFRRRVVFVLVILPTLVVFIVSTLLGTIAG